MLHARAERLLALGEQRHGEGRRFVLGIAGVPGSGKSTLGEKLTRLANDAGDREDTAVFIPMDGFHLPNATLVANGTKQRKGAHFTYDADAYIGLLRRYGDRANTGGFSVYCRVAHEPVPSEQRVTAATRVIITEGQYLLVDEPPWSELAGVLDETWWLDVSLDHARRWLRQRDLAVGRDPDEAERKYEQNDRLNTAWMIERRRAADVNAVWAVSGNDEGNHA